VLVVSVLSALNEVTTLHGHSTLGRRQLECPEEAVGFLEVGSNSDDFVDKIFHTDDAVLPEFLLDDGIRGKGNPLLAHLGKSSLVDQFANGAKVGLAVSNVGLHKLQHGQRSLVHTDKHTSVDVAKAKKLKNLADTGADTIDTIK
jgi:hypothetical protein